MTKRARDRSKPRPTLSPNYVTAVADAGLYTTPEDWRSELVRDASFSNDEIEDIMKEHARLRVKFGVN